MANLGDVAIKRVDEGISQKDEKSGKRRKHSLSAEQEELIVKFYDLFSPKKQFLVEYRASFPHNFTLSNLYAKVNVMHSTGHWEQILKRLEAEKGLQIVEKIRDVYVNESLCKDCVHSIICTHKLALPKTEDVVIGVIKCNYCVKK